METWLLVLLVVLTVHRFTRLITLDVVLDRPRDALTPLPWIGYLVNCAWCTSVWVAAGVVLACDALLEGGVPAPVLVGAAASSVTSVIMLATEDEYE